MGDEKKVAPDLGKHYRVAMDNQRVGRTVYVAPTTKAVWARKSRPRRLPECGLELSQVAITRWIWCEGIWNAYRDGGR